MKAFSYNSGYLTRLTDGWNILSFPIISRLLRDTLKTKLPQRILDFGAGAGTYAEVLHEFEGEVSACDISEESVAMCKGKYSSVFLIQKSSKLPSDEFDMIFSTEVLEHIKDYEETVRLFHLALRSQGVVVLTTTAYSTSVFTMLYQAKNSGGGLFFILGQIAGWMAGYASERRRDRFVERWCFEPLGGHYHGFRKGPLTKTFRAAGFSVLDTGVFYVVEPIAMPFLYSHTLRGLLKKKEWSITKRCLAAMIYIVAHPLNRAMKQVSLFANNIYIIARKDDRVTDTGC